MHAACHAESAHLAATRASHEQPQPQQTEPPRWLCTPACMTRGLQGRYGGPSTQPPVPRPVLPAVSPLSPAPCTMTRVGGSAEWVVSCRDCDVVVSQPNHLHRPDPPFPCPFRSRTVPGEPGPFPKALASAWYPPPRRPLPLPSRTTMNQQLTLDVPPGRTLWHRPPAARAHPSASPNVPCV